jgi:antitoxin (DNA-binding transcriptional repressor) of toxin-antitoxin stability system
MQITNIHEAETHLSQLIERVIAGEEIIIEKERQLVAKLIPYEQSHEPRQPGGSWQGKVRIADDFDELPEDLMAAFGVETNEAVT